MEDNSKAGVECGQCGERIFSWHRHDFVCCSCGACFVDGGNDYLRYGALGPSEIVYYNEDID